MKFIKTIKRLWIIKKHHRKMYYLTFGGTPRKNIPLSVFYRQALKEKSWKEFNSILTKLRKQQKNQREQKKLDIVSLAKGFKPKPYLADYIKKTINNRTVTILKPRASSFTEEDIGSKVKNINNFNKPGALEELNKALSIESRNLPKGAKIESLELIEVFEKTWGKPLNSGNKKRPD